MRLGRILGTGIIMNLIWIIGFVVFVIWGINKCTDSINDGSEMAGLVNASASLIDDDNIASTTSKVLIICCLTLPVNSVFPSASIEAVPLIISLEIFELVTFTARLNELL